MNLSESNKYLIVVLIICELSILVYLQPPKSNKLTKHSLLILKVLPFRRVKQMFE